MPFACFIKLTWLSYAEPFRSVLRFSLGVSKFQFLCFGWSCCLLFTMSLVLTVTCLGPEPLDGILEGLSEMRE